MSSFKESIYNIYIPMTFIENGPPVFEFINYYETQTYASKYPYSMCMYILSAKYYINRYQKILSGSIKIIYY